MPKREKAQKSQKAQKAQKSQKASRKTVKERVNPPKQRKKQCTMHKSQGKQCSSCTKSQSYLRKWIGIKRITERKDKQMAKRYYEKFLVCDKYAKS
jgi:RNA polymerase subunit RPABC4/transcription elongation factor Spt4